MTAEVKSPKKVSKKEKKKSNKKDDKSDSHNKEEQISSKRKREQLGESDIHGDDNNEDEKRNKSSVDKEERKAKKAKKKAEKEELLSKVPKTDENGIAYTKVQIKRMMKRMKRGLNPVPTEEEERERIRQLKLEKEEEESELAGMLYRKPIREEDNDEEGDNAKAEGDEDVDSNEEVDDVVEDEQEDIEDENGDHTVEKASDDIERPRKKPRNKPVPSDYTCMACNNKHQPLHWIYDCPDKIYKPGANKLKKKLRGIHDPASRKVFISGLPFDAKPKEVEMYFEKEMKCGKVVHCKLLQFEDTNRCKGTGFLTFETDEGAKKALKLNGTVFSLPAAKDDKKKTKKGNEKAQKELRLGVKKVLNRTVTKSKKSNQWN